jgi:selenocysteine-specific elongation factor
VLDNRWESAKDNIEKTYQAAGFSPPAPDDFQRNLPRDVIVVAILTMLADAGKLVPLEGNLYLHADTYNRAKDAIRSLATTPEGITVGSVRDATGSSRKIILPLLEHFDAVKFTRRAGDSRTLV